MYYLKMFLTLFIPMLIWCQIIGLLALVIDNRRTINRRSVRTKSYKDSLEQENNYYAQIKCINPNQAGRFKGICFLEC